MKKILFLSSLFCLATGTYAQSYRGSDADRMMYQRYQQNSQQNSNGSTYTPQRNYNNNYNSRSYNNNSTSSYSQSNVEKVIQGVYVYDNQLAVVRLRYYGGKVTHFSTSKDMMGREQWQTMYPDTPHPTMEFKDGQLAKEYKYKVSVSGTTVYFNL